MIHLGNVSGYNFDYVFDWKYTSIWDDKTDHDLIKHIYMIYICVCNDESIMALIYTLYIYDDDDADADDDDDDDDDCDDDDDDYPLSAMENAGKWPIYFDVTTIMSCM